MKIESSNISMMSTREYSKVSSSTSSVKTRVANNDGTTLGFFQNYLSNNQIKADEVKLQNPTKTSALSLKLQLIRRIFDSIAGRRAAMGDNAFSLQKGNYVDLRNNNYEEAVASTGTIWERTITTSYFFQEKEATTFSSTGFATTEDGRTISFNVELSLSRSFTSTYESFETAQYLITDPLTIDLEGSGVNVSDVKFLFDLDMDGVEEEISFAGSGNGFLALDLNEDGIINDGSELFGARTGNGWSELAKYDTDSNGWIDENDDIFSKLKVWTKDEDGNDRLIDLKAADVGAIYLGNTSTQFALTDQNNYANAFIRSTGIFLHESGSVGTISQLDLTS